MAHSPVSLYSRLPEKTARQPRPEPKPTRAQSLIEYILFAVFGLTILIAAVAVVAAASPSYRTVPNLVATGMDDDRVNVLVVATSGGRNIATEGLMLISVKPSTRDVAVMSIPSDLWVQLGRHGARRLGSAMAVGRDSGYPGGGPGLLADSVSGIVGQKVHGFIRVDRDDLKKLVDAVGGIDVTVARGAYEYAAPDRFTPGTHHLNGERAARFAFSNRMARPANDRFAREERQYAVIVGLMHRLPLLRVTGDVRDGVTNLSAAQLNWLSAIVSRQTPRTLTLAPYVDTFTVETLTDKGEALRPRTGDFDQVRQIAARVF